MDTDLYRIRASNIHGLGVFSNIYIHQATIIAVYLGEEMSWKDFTTKYGPYKENSLNTYPMRRVWKILVAKEELYKSQNIVNFINEGEPNCVLKKTSLICS